MILLVPYSQGLTIIRYSMLHIGDDAAHGLCPFRKTIHHVEGCHFVESILGPVGILNGRA